MEPGIHFYLPGVMSPTKRIPMNLLQDSFTFEVKTEDNAFSQLGISIQYRVVDPVEAYYSLNDPTAQMESFIENVVRSEAPKMDLNTLFSSQDAICKAVKETLEHRMSGFGYKIENTLITNIEPNHKIRDAMNEVLASQRLRDAAKYSAEAQRIEMVATAEADKERTT
jgi:regulator of protease activity HflC (stomatin/prohibitin superfamily)